MEGAAVKKPTNQYMITVTPLPDARDPLGYRRLRFGVKVLLRRFGLRCVEVRVVEQLEPMPDGEYKAGMHRRVQRTTLSRH
jgi:hypothetical protein